MTKGEMIRQTREHLGMTQEQFGEALGVTKQAVSHWERGRSLPYTESMVKLALNHSDWRRQLALACIDGQTRTVLEAAISNSQPTTGG